MRDNFQKLINKYAELSKDRYSDVSGVDFWKLLGRWYLEIDKLISAAYHIMRKLTVHLYANFRTKSMCSLSRHMGMIEFLKSLPYVLLFVTRIIELSRVCQF